MTLEFAPHQTVHFPAPQLGTSIPIGGPLTDAALARASANWQAHADHLRDATNDWTVHVQQFLNSAYDRDLATAWRLACL